MCIGDTQWQNLPKLKFLTVSRFDALYGSEHNVLDFLRWRVGRRAGLED